MSDLMCAAIMIIVVVIPGNLAISLYFGKKKREIVARFLQHDSVEIKNIKGHTDRGLAIMWFRFDLLVNKDSVFLFPYVAICNVIILNQPAINLRFVIPGNDITSRKNGLWCDAEGNFTIVYTTARNPLFSQNTIKLKRLSPVQINALQLFLDNNNADRQVLKEIQKY